MKDKVISYKTRAKKKATANRLKNKRHKNLDKQSIENNVINLQYIIAPDFYEDDLLRQEVIGNLRSRRGKTNGN
ncbi:hypothetical protein [Clostridium sp. YIM B02551]|uniref:hypothetical protein n=1 Tax=Clostridium sp. YIM B02551 TaxID=2910679 RepID=UPI001EEB5182|nr:hypothetical protein [Clostridium sp. YIM B02551]